jgi:hypothetical protein
MELLAIKPAVTAAAPTTPATKPVKK